MRTLLKEKKDLKLVFIDFETESLNLHLKFNRPWQCGMIKVIGNKEVANKELYIKWPDREINVSAEATKVTKFDLERYKEKAIDEAEVFNQIYEWLEEAEYCVGHNILGFDLYLLIQWFKLYGKEWKHLIYKFIDTHCLARAYKMQIPFKQDDNLMEWQYKLYHKIVKGVKTNQTLLGKEWGLEFDENKLHASTVEDLRLNLKIYNKLKTLIEI